MTENSRIKEEREEWQAIVDADTLHMLPIEAAVASQKYLAEQLLAATDPENPWLGLVSTRQLLLEIKARGESEMYHVTEGNNMAIGAANLIDMLPGSMLDYRTVDS